MIQMGSSRAFDPRLLTPAHLRAARALLNWSSQELAARAGVGQATIKRAEAADPRVRHETLETLVRALEDGGVVLTLNEGQGPGVYLKAPPQ